MIHLQMTWIYTLKGHYYTCGWGFKRLTVDASIGSIYINYLNCYFAVNKLRSINSEKTTYLYIIYIIAFDNDKKWVLIIAPAIWFIAIYHMPFIVQCTSFFRHIGANRKYLRRIYGFHNYTPQKSYWNIYIYNKRILVRYIFRVLCYSNITKKTDLSVRSWTSWINQIRLARWKTARSYYDVLKSTFFVI